MARLTITAHARADVHDIHSQIAKDKPEAARRFAEKLRENARQLAETPGMGRGRRDLEEMMAERGVGVDHVTLYRWVQRYAPELEKRVRWYQGYRSSSWRVDETYVSVGGKWKYLFRAVDKHGRLIDFMLSDRRNTKAARRFLAKALKVMRNWSFYRDSPR